jgi:transcriptional regulator with XRE-family HTH domain
MNAIRLLRELSDLTQSELAEAAGTSQPTIAAYEAGRKSPTVRTLSRLAEVAGLEATIGFHRPMTREERRSLHLHRAIARQLERSPEEVLAKARKTLSLMRSKHPKAGQLLREWEVVLDRPVSDLLPALTDPSPQGRELRQVTPFAGVLTAKERTEVYQSFRREESK